MHNRYRVLGRLLSRVAARRSLLVSAHILVVTAQVVPFVGAAGMGDGTASALSASTVLQVTSPSDSGTLYRVRATQSGDVVESSTDAGVHWTLLLAPSPATPVGHGANATVAVAPACVPASYQRVHALTPGTGAAQGLYVGTAGTPGNYLDGGCSSAAGGLFAGSAGSLVRLGTDGLPFAQDAVARTIRAYDVDVVTLDARNRNTIYVHASGGTGPGSPPEGLYRTRDFGRHWIEIDTGLRPSALITNAGGITVPTFGAGTLTVDPADSRHLTFTNDTGTYESHNAGTTWHMQGAPPSTLPAATSTPPSTPTGVTAAPQQRSNVAPAVSALPVGWAWREANASNAAPPARQDAALAWDSTDNLLLVFGGTDTTGSHNLKDLWAYSPATNTWTAGPTGPSSRFGASATWDPLDNVLLVFGGQTGAGSTAAYLGDLWAYRPSTGVWTLLTASGAPGAPSPRSHVVTAWDSSAHRLLVFSGEVSENPFQGTNDVWAFTPGSGGSSGTWTQPGSNNPACTYTCPQARFSSQGAWDSSSGTLRIFGGRNNSQSVLSDTWTWAPSGMTGGAWTAQNSATQPAGRAESAMAFDSIHGVVVAGPGLSLAAGDVDDVWAYLSGQNGWQPLPIAASPVPPVRRLTRWVWDAADGRFYLFGGRVPGVGAANDLWQLAPSAAVPAPTAQPTAPTTPALEEGWAVDNSGSVLVTPAQINSTSTAGARFVRINFRLGNAADWTDGARLAAYDTVVNNYIAAGIQVLGQITSEATHSTQADWTANNREVSGGTGDNAFITTTYVGNAVTPLLAHFHDRVKLWELWNEPNAYQSCSGSVCTGGSFIYPSNFAALLVDAYTAIKDPAPAGLGLSDVTLISGGLLGHSIGGALTQANAGADYLKNTFTMGVTTVGSWAAFASAHGGRYPLDALGQHMYVDQNLATTATDIVTYYNWLRGAVAAFETPPPTYLTEGAWSTNVVPQYIQAQNLDLLFGATRATGYVPLTTWFELQDVPQNNLFFGLTDANAVPKQAYSHYQTEAGGGPPTTTPTGTSTATALPSSTATASRTSTSTPSATSTPTASATATSTGVPATATFTHTPVSFTATPTRTSTPTPIGTTPLPTASATRTPAAADFSLSATPTSQSVPRTGGSRTYTVTIHPINGFGAGVTLSASGLPSTSSGQFSVNPATSTSVLTIRTLTGALAGTYTITIAGRSGTLSRSTRVTLTVTQR